MTFRWRLPLALVIVTLAALLLPTAWAQKPAEEELATLKAPPGFEIGLFASEPMITNPSAIDIDSAGRVWVAEIQFYRGKAANKPGQDKIKVLEDTDGDGKADKVTIFAEGLFAPMSVCVAGTKVYVATSPDLWVYEDKDGDLKADGPPTKLLTGFGGYNHDHGAHSIVLGPDHKWWMSHGDTGYNVKGVDGSHIQFKWGGMIRGELDGTKLENVATNFRNPYEICVSSYGEAYVSDNDNDGNQSVRICWILEGGDYGWFGGPPFGIKDVNNRLAPGLPFRETWHFRGYIPGHVPGTLVTGFGSPCGMCFYEGDAFGTKYKNAPYHCDAGPREVRIYRHEKTGYGMKASSENVLTTAGDNYFRPDDVCAAPDGSLFVADWYDGGVGGHAYNDPDRGRIFTLKPAGKKLSAPKPGPYANVDDAAKALKNPNLATQFLAREKLLAESQASVPVLKALLANEDDNIRARALWVLDRIGGDARKLVIEQLKGQETEMRALAVRILRRHGSEYAGQILPLAEDPSMEVRREVLLAAAKLDTDAAFETIVKIAGTYDGKDRYQLEAINIAAGKKKPELYTRLEKDGTLGADKLALMQVLDPKAAAAFLTASLSKTGVDEATGKALLEAAGGVAAPEAGEGVLKLAADAKAPAALRVLALSKLDANLSGSWKALATDAKLAASLKELLADKELQLAALDLVSTHNLASLGGDVQKLATDAATPIGVRQKALGVAVSLKPQGLADALRGLLASNDPPTRQAALNALVDLQDVKTLKDVLSGEKFSADVQTQTADRLMGTTGGALVLLKMIEAKGLREKLAGDLIAKATSHPDSNVRILYEKFLPVDQRPKRLGEAIKADDIMALKGDAKRGSQIFHQSTAAQCKNCHMVQGVGMNIGPDLSQIGKKYEKKTLLETILDPSKAIAPEYYAYLLETEGGQVHAGFLVEKTDQQVVLKDAKGQLIRVPSKEVATLAKQEKSLMPELVLRDVTAQDAADLLAYLTTLTEGTQAVGAFRVLGPLDRKGNLAAPLDPEKTIAAPNLAVEFAGVGGKKVTWDLVAAESAGQAPSIDTVKYDDAKKMRNTNVVHYFLVYADSASDQEVGLLMGSDDGVKVWVNGEVVHTNDTTRALVAGQDKARAKLKTGRNVIVMKVTQGDGGGGASLGITSSGLVQLKTE